jgi:hypothetical protein
MHKVFVHVKLAINTSTIADGHRHLCVLTLWTVAYENDGHSVEQQMPVLRETQN